MTGPIADWLAGVSVLDLTTNVAGPFATLILHDLGARVIKVERPPDGDPVRAWPPFAGGISAPFAALNRGKCSLAADLQTPTGRELVTSLAAHVDVFIESWRPGTAKNFGLDRATLRRRNPDLICCSVSAFGGVGPLGGQPGYDAVIQAYAGIMEMTGEASGPPVRTGTGFIDYGTGMWAALGIIGALLARANGAGGSELDASLLGTAVIFQVHHLASVMMAGVEPRRQGTAQHNTAPYEAIRVAEGRVMIGVSTQAVWAKLCACIDPSGGLRSDPRFTTNALRVANRIALVESLERIASSRQPAEFAEDLMRHGVPASVIQSIAAMPTDPQVEALGLLAKSASGVRLGRIPLTVNDQRTASVGAVPALGDHTESLLREYGLAGLVSQDTAAGRG